MSDESNLNLSVNCNDCDSRGFLIVDAAIKRGDQVENVVKRYIMRNLDRSEPLEGKKLGLRFFKEHVIEWKGIKNGQQLSIYDFMNKMTLFCQSFQEIIQVEVEEDAIYMLAKV